MDTCGGWEPLNFALNSKMSQILHNLLHKIKPLQNEIKPQLSFKPLHICAVLFRLLSYFFLNISSPSFLPAFSHSCAVQPAVFTVASQTFHCIFPGVSPALTMSRWRPSLTDCQRKSPSWPLALTLAIVTWRTPITSAVPESFPPIRLTQRTLMG